MDTFISIFDLLEKNQSISPIKDEIYSMQYKLKQEMDQGLTPEHMELAQQKNNAFIAAQEILMHF